MGTAEAKTIKDFTKGPVYDETLQRYLVEIRYPDGRRVRKRFRRERSAMRWWTSEQVRIDDGTWDETSPKVITVGKAFKIYRAHAELHHRSYKTYTRPQLGLLEKLLGADTALASVTVQRVEEIHVRAGLKEHHSCRFDEQQAE